jgi:SAM-dependent methyltransferase
MAVYEQLSAVYDELFPQNPAATAYILGLLQGKPAARILDLGSATGSQALDLAARGHLVQGFEPSPAMLRLAREKARVRGLPTRFEELRMQDAGDSLKPRSLDLVLCLGNTLPHLRDKAELLALFHVLAQALLPGGSLVLQLLNYDRVDAAMAEGHYNFPELKIGRLTFRRFYAPQSEGRLAFRTEISQDGVVEVDETSLRPFRKAEIETALEASGFLPPEARSGWQAAGFDLESDPYLILTASLPG